MKRLLSVIGYIAAVLTVAFAVLTPFVGFGYLIGLVAGAGFHIDPIYAGGEPERVIDKGSYQIVVHQPVLGRTLLIQREPFVQLTWKPASSLPKHISEEVDINADNVPDLRVAFEVPPDLDKELRVDVTPLNELVRPMKQVGKESFSMLIARVGDSIVVRVPITGKMGKNGDRLPIPYFRCP
jgi:hypothetical protein